MKRKFLKPIIASLVALVIPLGLVTTAFATDITPDTSGTTDNSPVTLETPPSFTVTIPQSYTFNNITKTGSTAYTSQSGTVSVSGQLLSEGDYLHVSFGDVDGDDHYNLVGNDPTTGGAGTTKKVAFDIYSVAPAEDGTGGSLITHNSKVIKNITNETSDSNELSKTCIVAFDRNNITASGTYTGSVKFTVTINRTAEPTS